MRACCARELILAKMKRYRNALADVTSSDRKTLSSFLFRSRKSGGNRRCAETNRACPKVRARRRSSLIRKGAIVTTSGEGERDENCRGEGKGMNRNDRRCKRSGLASRNERLSDALELHRRESVALLRDTREIKEKERKRQLPQSGSRSQRSRQRSVTFSARLSIPRIRTRNVAEISEMAGNGETTEEKPLIRPTTRYVRG